MFVILVYDVSVKHNRRISRICESYLYRTQQSVFEGVLTENQLLKLKAQLQPLIDVTSETISIYEVSNTSNITKQSIGCIPCWD